MKDKQNIKEFNLRLKKLETEHKLFDKDIRKLRRKIRSHIKIIAKNAVGEIVKKLDKVPSETATGQVDSAAAAVVVVAPKSIAEEGEKLDEKIASLEKKLLDKCAELGLRK
ncbi:MAG: hypothetical protein Harvfovirus4_10 [Harvfovirus sp.]|uniref:Uncharacterized protein n=1 Tax=Harvfovirus sp. TaxID=2487768 RepID=A0A3G5A093_9VIRU|nr:MAG: hypothetical protein Harvfovirus4_10 [Harvfovirus sp.]